MDINSIDKNNIKEFNKWSKVYDSPLNHLSFHLANKKLLQLLNLEKGKALLDVGCGTGILLGQLVDSPKELDLYGLDVSDDMLAVAKRKLAGKQMQLVQGSALKMPFKDNSFDYVTCVHSFHHHPDSFQSLREMKRVVKKGGKVAILDNFLDGAFRTFFHKIEKKLFPRREGDIRRYTKEEMKKLFEQVGLSNIKQATHQYFSLITIGEK